MAEKIEEAVREAGGMILSAHLKESDIHKKTGPANFVTDYDIRIQQLLISTLSGILPGCSFYGEEDTDQNESRVSAGYTFFIDPIDGTTNFMFDYHNSCVSVGLSLAGRLIAGWVYNPYSDQFWSAEKGKGAFLNGKRLKMENKGLEAGICAFGCARYNEGDKVFRIIEELFMRSLSIRNGGSAAIDLCRIASGSNVGYVEMNLKPYDYAAATVIVTEAGGVIGQSDGSQVTLDRSCSVVAGTEKASEEIRDLLKPFML
ncbi:MAG: inositol monophosphatase [Lachnospiraceae bacterium]|nr:inositol monophosphatase [Lachnospiraceae bacterium]